MVYSILSLFWINSDILWTTFTHFWIFSPIFNPPYFKCSMMPEWYQKQAKNCNYMRQPSSRFILSFANSTCILLAFRERIQLSHKLWQNKTTTSTRQLYSWSICLMFSGVRVCGSIGQHSKWKLKPSRFLEPAVIWIAW